MKDRPTTNIWLPYLGYLILHILLSPFLALRGIERARRRNYQGLVLSRLLGGGVPPVKDRWMVFVAGSLGETRPALRIAEVAASEHNLRAAVLAQTNGGMSARHPVIPVCPAPFNSPFSALLFLLRWRPCCIWACESMDNVHLSVLAHAFGIPTIVYNFAYTEEQTHQALERVKPWRVQAIARYGVQSEDHRDRILRMGAAPRQVRVTGPLGLAIGRGETQGVDPEAVRSKWRQRLHLEEDAGPVVVAGSCWEQEEPLLVQAYLAIRAAFPKAVLVLAPRHLDRQNLSQALDAASLDHARVKAGFDCLPSSRIVILDTYGELKEAYSVGDFAFVGGTYTDSGGHTPVEALAWDLPVTLGPRYPQQRVIIDPLIEEEAAFVCEDAQKLTETWLRLSQDAGLRAKASLVVKNLSESDSHRIAEFIANLGLSVGRTVH